jgi:NADP-dependent 3-hydroxy acid dehydrogenase YdfG
MKQTILVTGASSGFGLLIANKLHAKGYTVIGTSRDPEKYQSKLPFKLLPLDIADDHSMESFGKNFSPKSNIRCADKQRGFLFIRTCRRNVY